MSMNLSEYLRLISACGQGYLSSGGPTSRLEEKLMEAGQTNEYPTEVYATPTGMFISVKRDGKVYTSFERIVGNETNFSDMLFFDKLLEAFSLTKVDGDWAKKKIESFRTRRHSFYLVALATFLIGLLASYLRYGHFYGAIISGCICAFIYVLNHPLIVKLKFSGVFTDFVGSFVAFFLSVIASYAMHLPATVFVIGSLILIVPGLTLTSAISELADHNFVSGTVKLMKAILILVAMGVAYSLVDNILESIGTNSEILVQKINDQSSFWRQGFFKTLWRTLLIGCFCIYFHTPWRAIPGAIFCSLMSIFVLDQFMDPQYFVMGSFLASMMVGAMSLLLSRTFRWPSQIFSTPGILSLVPGLLALSAFYNIDNPPNQGVIAYRVALTAGAIVFGLFTARMPFRIYKKLKNESLSFQ